MLLDMIYFKIKKKVNCLLEANNMIDIVFNENNNQVDNKILNITVFTKDHEFFYIFFKSASVIKFDAQVTVAQMLENIDQLKRSDFKKVNCIIIDICSLEHAV